MIQRRGFILLDLLLGMSMLAAIAITFTQLSFLFKRRSNELADIRHAVQIEHATAYQDIVRGHHPAGNRRWRITALQIKPLSGSSLPSGCQWYSITEAGGRRLPPLFALHIQTPIRPSGGSR